MEEPWIYLEQAALALVYYAMLILVMRLSGKRLAGQTTTFDLIVLIAMGVVLQNTMLREGTANSLIFVAAVFAAHKGLALATARSPGLRRLLRGRPQALIRDGKVLLSALEEEGLSYEDLLAGLRKLGHASPGEVRLAVLEETGHISVIPADGEPQVGERADTVMPRNT